MFLILVSKSDQTKSRKLNIPSTIEKNEIAFFSNRWNKGFFQAFEEMYIQFLGEQIDEK